MTALAATNRAKRTQRRQAVRGCLLALTLLLVGSAQLALRPIAGLAQQATMPEAAQGEEDSPTDPELPPAYFPPGQSAPKQDPAAQAQDSVVPSPAAKVRPFPVGVEANPFVSESDNSSAPAAATPVPPSAPHAWSNAPRVPMLKAPAEARPDGVTQAHGPPVTAKTHDRSGVNPFIESPPSAASTLQVGGAPQQIPAQNDETATIDRPPYIDQLLLSGQGTGMNLFGTSQPTSTHPPLELQSRSPAMASGWPPRGPLEVAQVPTEVITPEPPTAGQPGALPDFQHAPAPSAKAPDNFGMHPAHNGQFYAAAHCDNNSDNAAYDDRVFIPNPSYERLPYFAEAELGVYSGKYCVPFQAPWVELWRGLYRPGPLPPAGTLLTETNPIIPHFLVFGDYRTAIAFNDNGNSGDEVGVWAHRLNLDFDLKITSTERIHAFWGPLDDGGRFTRAELRDDNLELKEEFDDDFDTLFFEGDAGYIWGGMTDRWAPFDLPFVAGKYPLLFQNGIWMVDAIEGLAFTIPGRNSPLLDWSNFEITFFWGFDDIDSPAFGRDDNAADAYGVTTFIDAYEGYVELGYAFLNDRTGQGLSYHNIGLAYTRRYFQRISNSIRAIINTGQDPLLGEQTADGQLILLENSWITRHPNFFVPYLNMFAGFDRPQSVARAAGAGGILLNTGINFETDGLTGYPTLDATANDTWGGAVGMNLLGPDFCWQLVTELAMVQTFGGGGQRQAVADQYAAGVRWQRALNNAWILRLDGMYGYLEDAPDIRGARAELRWKF